MKGIYAGRDDIGVTDRSLIWNSDLAEALELDNLLSSAMTTMVGASPPRKPRRPRA